MNLYDRYLDKFVNIKDLPNHIDFGRYCFIDINGNITDITYSNLQTTNVIRQEILLEKNKNLQEILIDIDIEVGKSSYNVFNSIPLIRRIKNKLGLNEFEKLLLEKVFHLEEVFRTPHYLLERKIEKVNVSRAKRIPTKSYQYLASHTEDWIHKSIVNFKPSRILSEELDLNFDVYENQLSVAFLERCLMYLNSRIKEIQDIKSFLFEYERLLQSRNDSSGWYKKINRNLSLIGAVYEDDHFQNNSNQSSILTETEELLNQLYKRLISLRKCDLYSFVNKRSSYSIVLRNTNVLVNHRHYRYVKLLWSELDKVKPEKSESEKVQYEQKVFNGLRAYGKSIITYTLKENLDFELTGNYHNFKADHLLLSKIGFTETDKDVFELEIGAFNIRIVILGNLPKINDVLGLLKSNNTFIFYYGEQTEIKNERIIPINPLDPDSIERVGALIRKQLLIGYLDNLYRKFQFKPLLKDFVKYITSTFIQFKGFSYSFHSYPCTKLPSIEIKKAVETDSLFKVKSKPEQIDILKALSQLLTEIESNSYKLIDEYLSCFNCNEKLYSHHINHLNYIKCPSCQCLIDSSSKESIIFKIADDKYSSISKEEFGLDYLIFNRSEL